MILIDMGSEKEWCETSLPQEALAIYIHNPVARTGSLGEVRVAFGRQLKLPVAMICAAGIRPDGP